jgi:Mrp family chromosome partitioning ATPase
MVSLLDPPSANTTSPPSPSVEVGEPYLTLFRSLACQASAAAGSRRAIGLTSCVSGEGVTTVAVGLAMAAAAASQRVLLIDANDQRPCVHRLLAIQPGPGFAAAARGESVSAWIRPSAVPNLVILAAGQRDGSGTVDATAARAALRAWKEDFSPILLDLPPLAEGGFTVQLAALLDGVVLVVEAERLRSEVIRQEKELLAQAGMPLLGAVLNKRRQYAPRWLSRML